MKRLTTHIPGGPRKGCCLQISCTCTDCLGKCVFPWNTGGLHSGTAWGSNIRPEGKEFTTYKKEYGSLGEERFRREGPERKHESERAARKRKSQLKHLPNQESMVSDETTHFEQGLLYSHQPYLSPSLRPPPRKLDSEGAQEGEKGTPVTPPVDFPLQSPILKSA